MWSFVILVHVTGVRSELRTGAWWQIRTHGGGFVRGGDEDVEEVFGEV